MKFKIDPKVLGKHLSDLRQKAGLSQAKISKVCEVNSPQYISNIERGQCLPSLKILKLMLIEYKVNKDDRDHLISLFVQAARSEIEDIFSVQMDVNYNLQSRVKIVQPTQPKDYNEGLSLAYSIS